jgi:DNA-binding SARP family transcriptional activator
LAKLHLQRATLELFEGHYEKVLSEARRSLQMLSDGEEPERADARRHVGRAYLGLGRFAEGTAELQRSLALYRELGSPYDVVNLLQDLTLACASQGKLDQAAYHSSEALPIARRLDSPAQLAGVLNNSGALRYLRGEYREALARYEEGLAAARRGGDLRGQANICKGLASIYRDVGDYHRAELLYDTVWRIARESRPSQAVQVLASRADIRRWLGNHEEALELLGRARQLTEERSLDFERCGLLAVARGIALTESGDIRAGLRSLSDGVSFLVQQGARRQVASARFLLAKAYLIQGDKDRALSELRRALQMAEELGTYQFAVTEGQHPQDLLRLGVNEDVKGCRTVLERIQELEALRKELRPGADESEADVRLEIYALGAGRFVRDGREVPPSKWRGRMTKELFFYVLLHGPLARDDIGLVFWPDLPPKDMANNFHVTLYHLRQAVGDDVVVVDDGQYQIGDIDYWFDVQAFESLTERASLLPPYDWQAEDLWRRAVRLYKGPFLPEVERPWCVPQREALQETYIKALIMVGRSREARGAVEEAVAWYRRALAVDPLREDIHRAIIRCYAEAERRSDALAQYSRCEEILQQELGIEPSSETKKLHQRITRGD